MSLVHWNTEPLAKQLWKLTEKVHGKFSYFFLSVSAIYGKMNPF